MSKVPNIGPLVPVSNLPVVQPSGSSLAADNVRVNPVPMELVLLDEIAGRLADVFDLIALTIPRGLTYFTTINVVGPSEPAFSPFDLGDAVLFTASLVNDGPNSVQFAVNYTWANAGIINMGETIRIDFNKAVIRSFYFSILNNAVGTASLRLYGEY